MKNIKKTVLKAVIIAIAVFAFFPTAGFASGGMEEKIIAYLNAKGYEVNSLIQGKNTGQWYADTQKSYNTMVLVQGSEIIASQDMGVGTPVDPIIWGIVGVIDGF